MTPPKKGPEMPTSEIFGSDQEGADDGPAACVLVFNANDPAVLAAWRPT